jgi:hypothetical protein
MALLRVLVAVLVVTTCSPLFAQDSLSGVRQSYVNADYEATLVELDRLPPTTDEAEQLERDRYRAMTLIALGRTPEAQEAIERILLVNPRYELSEEEAAPRIRHAFDEVRLRVLPRLARSLYEEGRASFDRKEMAKAQPTLEQALAVLDLLPPDEPGTADLRTLVSGFLQLSRASISAAPGAALTQPEGVASPGPPTPVPVATSGASPPDSVAPAAVAPAGSPAAPSTTAATTAPGEVPPSTAETPAETNATAAPSTTTDGTPPAMPAADTALDTEPVALHQVFPEWSPPRNQSQPVFSGIVEVEIDEAGDVVSARMINAVHPLYDQQLLEAAKDWKYDPARRAGRPVKSSKRVSVILRPF